MFTSLPLETLPAMKQVAPTMVDREAKPVETRNFCLSSEDEKERCVLQVDMMMRFPTRQDVAEALVKTALNASRTLPPLPPSSLLGRGSP